MDTNGSNSIEKLRVALEDLKKLRMALTDIGKPDEYINKEVIEIIDGVE